MSLESALQEDNFTSGDEFTEFLEDEERKPGRVFFLGVVKGRALLGALRTN